MGYKQRLEARVAAPEHNMWDKVNRGEAYAALQLLEKKESEFPQCQKQR